MEDEYEGFDDLDENDDLSEEYGYQNEMEDEEKIIKRDKATAERDWFFPAIIVAMLKEGKINKTEFLLLGAINSLCFVKGSKEKKWCYASNTYLGKQILVTSNRISHVVSHLIDKGLLKRRIKKQDNGSYKRFLKPKW